MASCYTRAYRYQIRPLAHPHSSFSYSSTGRRTRASSASSSIDLNSILPPPLFSSPIARLVPLLSTASLPPLAHHGGSNGNNSDNSDNNGWRWEPDGWWNPSCSPLLLLLLLFFFFFLFKRNPDSSVEPLAVLSRLLLWFFPFPSSALAKTLPASSSGIWEVKGGKWTRLVPDHLSGGDSFVDVDRVAGDGVKPDFRLDLESLWRNYGDLITRLLLPEGYPQSVSDDYLEYSLWRGVQGVASQISGVLATQALLYAVGLGKGAIPTAAAVNWVLKDGIGYLSKIFLSNFGRHFDVNPKGWRLFADLLENAAYGLEITAPAFPHLFVFIGAAAGAGRSAAALIQAATRSCFYAGFAVQRNYAEVIAKGEAQGMVSKFVGIMLGIALANCIGTSTPLALVSFVAVTGVHMYCNFKSYKSIQLRTLNPYRASLVFSEYLLTGQVPSIREVNDVEPLFPALPIFNVKTQREQSQLLSSEAKGAAAEIFHRLQLACKLSEIVNNKEDALALFNLYKDEGYLLAIHNGKFCVILKEGSSPQDMLKSLFQVNYLAWLERNMGLESGRFVDQCRSGGRLQISLEYTQRELGHVQHDGSLGGWVMNGLIARPLPNRVSLGYAALPGTS